MTTIDEQYDYITACGKLTDFKLDREYSSEVEFDRLAFWFLGWEPAGPVWCANWKACFGEDYVLDATSPNILTPVSTPSLTSIEMPHVFPRSPSTPFTLLSESTVCAPNSPRSISPQSSRNQLPDRPSSITQGWGSPQGWERLPDSPSCAPWSQSICVSREERVAQYFNDRYGTDYNDLSAWQRLCADVGIYTPLASKTQCKKALSKVYVNIYDFVIGNKLCFNTAATLKKYSMTRDRVFPLAEAKEGTFIRALLHGFFPRKKKPSGSGSWTHRGNDVWVEPGCEW